MVPDYSNNSLHYNLDDRATRDAVLEQNQHHRQNYQKKPKPETISPHKRCQKEIIEYSMKHYLAEGGGDLLRLDPRRKGESLLELL